jgi:hypothetical protein
MTAAEDRREDLEALLWKRVAPAFGRSEAQALVAEILAAADAYAMAGRPRPPKKPAGAPEPRAVHYAPASSGYPACRPADPLSARNWAVTADRQAVTCGHCRKVLAREPAGELP